MPVSTVKLNGVTLMTVNDTTATQSDVTNSKYFYTADGTKSTGSIVNGDLLEYGLTDGTLPLVGVAKADSAVV